MTYAADLHIHSSYARSTSRELNFENLARWAKIKGIDLLATGDFTHPVWFAETRQKLNDTGDGLFELDGAKFVLGTELNCNGPQSGRNRRIHMLAFAPSLETVAQINKALARRTKSLESDGRPTIHMTPRELVSTLMDIDERCIIIPAHVWTPWFGMYGSKSGFDSLEECFGDALETVTAIETGLSSDPAMCWQVPELDNLSLVSFSDAHSLPKLARELTVMNGEPSYDSLAQALRTQDIAYTVEFFPEEGKYHYSGHRKCGISYSPDDVSTYGRTCPVCARRMTLGVMQRVTEIGARDVATDRDDDGLTRADNGRPPFRSLISLQQIVAEALGFGVNTKRVQNAYTRLIETFGAELGILLDTPSSDIADALPENGERVSEGVSKVRAGDIYIEPGFDGQFGKVQVWPDESANLKASRPSQSRMAL
ncbi:MAG: endonuclease Q family protein [SAR202 cluster bacterium]|nr:endonuclease Q family protein [SAR202 cluster bacterium]MDP6513916.1 endonuclease Q family protein [SAR202 cluster bacterium]MDP6714222.1 endonuclease Q family protein [SAR202 cluster bacterium]